MATYPAEGLHSTSLLPDAEYRQAISWLIKLRWIAIAGVIVAVAVTAHLFQLVPHWMPLYLIAAGMVVYNVGYHLLNRWGAVGSRPLVLSQITLDLIALTALLHYAGGAENPFSWFFVFHVILASILLPERESYAVATLACGLFVCLTLGEYLGVLPHYPLGVPYFQMQGGGFPVYPVGLLTCFVCMIFGATYLTVSIAARLRQRDTQLRDLLAYSQGLIDHLGDKICVIGPDYRIHFANDLVRRNLTGDNGRTCYATLWGEEKPCRACPLTKVTEEGKVVTLTREDDQNRVYEQICSPLPASPGAAVMIEKCRDITSQVALQRELVLSEKLAVIGELAAGLAHDIGNPLDGCQHALELVRRRVPPSINVHTFLELMGQGLRRIDLIVSRFLMMAREDGVHKKMVHVPEVIDSALLFLEHRIAERDITIEKDWAPSLPPLLADPDVLCQALTNVLLNAAEAIEGPGKIGITARYREHDGRGSVEIRIADSGCGIHPRDLERIFEPFFTTKPDGKGTGLGLAITKRFILGHGGDVSVHSTVGTGSTVVISLPAEEDKPSERKEGIYG
jgi:two-component system NtrC family sensor kinase